MTWHVPPPPPGGRIGALAWGKIKSDLGTLMVARRLGSSSYKQRNNPDARLTKSSFLASAHVLNCSKDLEQVQAMPTQLAAHLLKFTETVGHLDTQRQS